MKAYQLTAWQSPPEMRDVAGREVRYIGRLGVRDDDYEPLPFYSSDTDLDADQVRKGRPGRDTRPLESPVPRRGDDVRGVHRVAVVDHAEHRALRVGVRAGPEVGGVGVRAGVEHRHPRRAAQVILVLGIGRGVAAGDERLAALAADGGEHGLGEDVGLAGRPLSGLRARVGFLVVVPAAAGRVPVCWIE